MTCDEVLTTQLPLFMRDVVPKIERLTKMKIVGPGDTQVHSLIAQAHTKVVEISAILGEQNKCSDSTR